MTAESDAEHWTSWEVQRPTDLGTYWWRLKSVVIPEITLIFAAKLLPCDEFRKIPVPPFYYWNKWRAVVPHCEWKPAPNIDVDKYSVKFLSIEDLEFLPCPFCGKIPRLRACRCGKHGEIIAEPNPQNYNCWSLRCCNWGSTPDLKDPRKIEQIRRAAFARVKENILDK